MKCRFCNQQMLPVRSLPFNSALSLKFITWECLLCPHPVRQRKNDPRYGILYYYNHFWYEVSQDFSNNKEPTLRVFKYSFTEEKIENGESTITPQIVLELNVDAKITPHNINFKLPNLLVFS